MAILRAFDPILNRNHSYSGSSPLRASRRPSFDGLSPLWLARCVRVASRVTVQIGTRHGREKGLEGGSSPPRARRRSSSALTPESATTRRLRIGVDTGGTFTDLVAVDERDGQRAHASRCPRRRAQPVDGRLRGAGAACGSHRTRSATSSSARRSPRTPAPARGPADALPDHGRLRGHPVHPAHRPQGPLRPPVGEADAVRAAARLHRRRERVLATARCGRRSTDAEVERRRRRASRERDAETPAASRSRSTSSSPTSIPSTSGGWPTRCARRCPTCRVSVSHEVAPIWREYERGNTVIVDAYLRRLIGRLRRASSTQGLDERRRCAGRAPAKSNGGQVP